MQEELWKIFENVNSWLEYGERKNTYLLAFITLQLTLVKLFQVELNNSYFVVSLIVLGLCLFIAVGSFVPRTKIADAIYFWAASYAKPNDTDNLLFYGHIVKYPVGEYIAALDKRYFSSSPIRGNRYLEDLCNQIVVNAGITSFKFNIFKVAVGVWLVGEVLFLIALIG